VSGHAAFHLRAFGDRQDIGDGRGIHWPAAPKDSNKASAAMFYARTYENPCQRRVIGSRRSSLSRQLPSRCSQDGCSATARACVAVRGTRIGTAGIQYRVRHAGGG